MLAQELTDGGADNNIKVQVVLTWTTVDGTKDDRTYTYTDTKLQEYAARWKDGAFFLTIKGIDNVDTLTAQALLVSTSDEGSVIIGSETLSIK